MKRYVIETIFYQLQCLLKMKSLIVINCRQDTNYVHRTLFKIRFNVHVKVTALTFTHSPMSQG
jgi:hypothetical protein